MAWLPVAREARADVVVELGGRAALRLGHVAPDEERSSRREPFGIVMIEAMAAGTPVLAFPEGAAPEVVEHGVSGYLVADEDEMAAMVDDVGRLDPLQVRRSAERFAPDRIAAGYEQAYRAAMQREPAGALS